MKTILFFALLLVFTLAEYSPKWLSCSAATDPWQPEAPTLANEPVVGQKDTAHCCGTVTNEFTIGSFVVTYWYSFHNVFSQTVNVTQQDLQLGSQYCIDYSLFIPPYVSYMVSFELQNVDQETTGCLDMYL